MVRYPPRRLRLRFQRTDHTASDTFATAFVSFCVRSCVLLCIFCATSGAILSFNATPTSRTTVYTWIVCKPFTGYRSTTLLTATERFTQSWSGRHHNATTRGFENTKKDKCRIVTFERPLNQQGRRQCRQRFQPPLLSLV